MAAQFLRNEAAFRVRLALDNFKQKRQQIPATSLYENHIDQLICWLSDVAITGNIVFFEDEKELFHLLVYAYVDCQKEDVIFGVFGSLLRAVFTVDELHHQLDESNLPNAILDRFQRNFVISDTKLTDLPDDVWLIIFLQFLQLSNQALLQLRLTCKTFDYYVCVAIIETSRLPEDNGYVYRKRLLQCLVSQDPAALRYSPAIGFFNKCLSVPSEHPAVVLPAKRYLVAIEHDGLNALAYPKQLLSMLVEHDWGNVRIRSGHFSQDLTNCLLNDDIQPYNAMGVSPKCNAVFRQLSDIPAELIEAILLSVQTMAESDNVIDNILDVLSDFADKIKQVPNALIDFLLEKLVDAEDYQKELVLMLLAKILVRVEYRITEVKARILYYFSHRPDYHAGYIELLTFHNLTAFFVQACKPYKSLPASTMENALAELAELLDETDAAFLDQKISDAVSLIITLAPKVNDEACEQAILKMLGMNILKFKRHAYFDAIKVLLSSMRFYSKPLVSIARLLQDTLRAEDLNVNFSFRLSLLVELAPLIEFDGPFVMKTMALRFRDASTDDKILMLQHSKSMASMCRQVPSEWVDLVRDCMDDEALQDAAVNALPALISVAKPSVPTCLQVIHNIIDALVSYYMRLQNRTGGGGYESVDRRFSCEKALVKFYRLLLDITSGYQMSQQEIAMLHENIVRVLRENQNVTEFYFPVLSLLDSFIDELSPEACQQTAMSLLSFFEVDRSRNITQFSKNLFHRLINKGGVSDEFVLAVLNSFACEEERYSTSCQDILGIMNNSDFQLSDVVLSRVQEITSNATRGYHFVNAVAMLSALRNKLKPIAADVVRARIDQFRRVGWRARVFNVDGSMPSLSHISKNELDHLFAPIADWLVSSTSWKVNVAIHMTGEFLPLCAIIPDKIMVRLLSHLSSEGDHDLLCDVMGALALSAKRLPVDNIELITQMKRHMQNIATSRAALHLFLKIFHKLPESTVQEMMKFVNTCISSEDHEVLHLVMQIFSLYVRKTYADFAFFSNDGVLFLLDQVLSVNEEIKQEALMLLGFILSNEVEVKGIIEAFALERLQDDGRDARYAALRVIRLLPERPRMLVLDPDEAQFPEYHMACYYFDLKDLESSNTCGAAASAAPAPKK